MLGNSTKFLRVERRRLAAVLTGLAMLLAQFPPLPSSSPVALAAQLSAFTTVLNTNVVSAGVGGMRGTGTGTIALTGVTGTVTKALLYWQGPTNSTSPTANATVTFASTLVTGTNIGFSNDNCWNFTNSQGYRADVTSLVTGNGNYALSNFVKTSGINVNGASLIVFFNDPTSTSKQDVYVFDGNDSNVSNTFDPPGWSATLPGISYSGGPASLELHVSDGQMFTDAALVLNGTTLVASGAIFQGDSLPGGTGPTGNGNLWDIKSFDITTFLTPGTNTLSLTSGDFPTFSNDCLSLVVAMVKVPFANVVAWGGNPSGQIGDGTTVTRLTPVPVSLQGVTTQVAAGRGHTLALKADGTVWAWGANGSGQLGDGTTTTRLSPVQVVGLSDAIAVAAGGFHSLALRKDGTVAAWGQNDSGQLGDGTATNRLTPVQVKDSTGVAFGGAAKIAAGDLHSLAIKTTGTAWAWGQNFVGQLGDGTTINGPNPVQVAAVGTLVEVAGGFQHSLGIEPGGSVWVWGQNSAGQLCDATTPPSRSTPFNLSALTISNVIKAGANGTHSVFLKSDGTVFACGFNGVGQLGNGTTSATAVTTPVQVKGVGGTGVLTNVTAIAASAVSNFTLALRGDGTVVAWGDNNFGELGDGTSGNTRSAPVQVSGLTGALGIAAGGQHSVAIRLPALTGTAQCPIGEVMTPLPGAKVELFSGTSLVATTTADAATAAYAFLAIAAGTYTVRYTLHPTPSTTVTCGTQVTQGTGGGATVPVPPPLLDLHNHSWPAAFMLNPLGTPGSPVSANEHLFLKGQSAWFKFKVQPGSKVIVTLTGASSPLPANYDLTLYTDIAAKFKQLTTPQDLARLGAEFAPDAFAPDAFAPDAFAPDAFAPDAFAPDAFAPDAFAPDAFAPDAFAPDAFAPDAFAPDAFAPDAYAPDAFAPDAFAPDAFAPDAFAPDAFAGGETVSPDAFAGAQTRSLIGVSAFDGTSGEGLRRNTWDNGDNFYVRVKGRNGAFSLAAPFHLEVTILTGTCGLVNPITTASPTTATAGTFKTIILTDPARTAGTDVEKATLAARLATFAGRPEVAGAVVNVGADARVAAANAQADANTACPFAKNLVAAAIKEIVDKYRAAVPPNPLEFVVIVGNDNVIPYFRHPDLAGLANEKNYSPPVLDSSALQASLKLGYVLSQDRYGSRIDIARNVGTFPIPDLAVGRLIETAADMTGMLDAYLGTSGGVTPINSSALVTGYDFIADVAAAIRDELAAGLGAGGSVDTLIEAGNLPPTDPSAWTAGQLRSALLESRRDLVFLGGHFSATSALAADYTTRLRSSEVAASTVDLTNMIVWSEGCHSGLNIPNPDAIPGVTGEPDFPQAFAKKRVTTIAGTGYQYGDTELIEYGERLYLEFTRQLRSGTGAVSVGKALVRAKKKYLADTAALRGIHEKTLLESTLFGLPHLSVNLPGARLPTTPDTSIVGAATGFAKNPGLTLGLASADVTITPSLTQHTVPLTITGTNPPVTVTPAATFLSGSSGVVANPDEPILPLEARNVSVAVTVLRGVGFRAGTYGDTLSVRPKTSAATTEIRTPHGPFTAAVFYPVRPWTVNYTDALGGGATRLMVTPAQFVSTAPETGTRRAFTSMSFQLFYSNNFNTYTSLANTTGNTPALAAAPAISNVSGVPGASIAFRANVEGDPSAGIQAVWVTYTAVSGDCTFSGPCAGQWRSLDLAQGTPPFGTTNPSTRWTGNLALQAGQAASDVRYIVQAVNGVGLVALETCLGAYCVPAPDTVAASSPKQPTAVAFLTPTLTGLYRDKVTFSAQLTSNGTPLGGRTLTFGLGSARSRAVTEATAGPIGVATATFALLQSPGPYELSVSFDETSDLLGSADLRTFTITKRGTSLALSPACVPLQATLRDTSLLQRTLREQTVFFQVGGSQTQAVITDFQGRAPLGSLTLPAGTYTVNARFGGTITVGGQTVSLANDRYETSTATAALAFGATDVAVAYTGQTVIPSGTALAASATVTTTRNLTDARICFVVKDPDGNVAALGSGAVTAGAAAASIAGLPVGVYTVESTAVGGSQVAGFFSSAATETVGAVFNPAVFVTGGGFVLTTTDSSPTLPAGKKANFGFNLQYKTGTTIPTGSLLVQMRDASPPLTLKATGFDWLVVSGSNAMFQGSAVLNGSGAFKFRVEVDDLSAGDRFRIRVWNDATQSVDNPQFRIESAGGTIQLGGGSIVVH